MRKNSVSGWKWPAVFLVIATVLAGGTIFAMAEDFKDIDAAVKAKITACLIQKGHENIVPSDGKIIHIQNGYFAKVNGIDKKTNKGYYMEMICTGEYANWAILAINEKNGKDTLSKK